MLNPCVMLVCSINDAKIGILKLISYLTWLRIVEHLSIVVHMATMMLKIV